MGIRHCRTPIRRTGRNTITTWLTSVTAMSLWRSYVRSLPRAWLIAGRNWKAASSQQPGVPRSLPEALRLAADLAEQKERLAQELAAAAPKVEFVDRYCSASGSLSFRQVAKLLKAKETDFRLFLIDNEIMYRLGGVLTPRHQHIDAGRFEVKTGTSTTSNHAFSQARFTAKGVKWIAGLWAEHVAKGNAA